MPRILSGGRVCGIMVAMTPSPRSRPRSRSLLRSRGAVATSLLAVLAGGAVTGGLMASAMDDPSTPAADRIKAIVPQGDPRPLSGPAYADAVPGTCLAWAGDGGAHARAGGRADHAGGAPDQGDRAPGRPAHLVRAGLRGRRAGNMPDLGRRRAGPRDLILRRGLRRAAPLRGGRPDRPRRG